MCIIIYRPQYMGKVPEDNLWHSWLENADGAGLMWSTGNGVHVHKGLWDWEDIRRAVRKVPKSAELVIHFRWRTHGPINKRNCHPFPVNEDLWMAHNGIIHLPITSSKWSDSLLYSRLLRMRLEGPTILEDERATIARETAGSKLVFLSSAGDTTIIGEEAGHWDDGLWYSNRSYVPWKPAEPTRFISYQSSANEDYFSLRSDDGKPWN